VADGPAAPSGDAKFYRLRRHYLTTRKGLRVSTLFRVFRRGGGGELLEARIIPERIEHRIEPEQRRSERLVRSHFAPVRYRD
jgi:hypothetical protein